MVLVVEQLNMGDSRVNPGFKIGVLSTVQIAGLREIDLAEKNPEATPLLDDAVRKVEPIEGALEGRTRGDKGGFHEAITARKTKRF